MKCLLSLLFISMTFALNAKEKPNYMLHCLGKEELGFHKSKKTGPYYRLNQLFINELAGANDLHLKKSYIDRICKSKEHPPSVGLLKSLILEGKKIYNLKLTGQNAGLNAYKISGIIEFRDRIPHIFFRFLADLQSLGPDPHCLKRNIPELNYFLERYKHLENEYPYEMLIDDTKKINIIFNKLRFVAKTLKKCTKQFNKKKQSKSSKKK